MTRPASEGADLPPEAAAAAFGAHLGTAAAYAELLAGPAVERGLLGPREVPRLWERHLLNCVAVAPALPADAQVADLGSGAGLPGLVVAIARPDLRMTLIEPLQRRATFLGEAVARLGLANVEVRRARAEELRGGPAFEVVLARAVAPLDRLAGWALPLLRPGGTLVALKGASAAEELAAAASTLAALGAVSWAVRERAVPGVEPATTVVEVVAGVVGTGRKGSRKRVSRETARGSARG